jgi:hypothetical protein
MTASSLAGIDRFPFAHDGREHDDPWRPRVSRLGARRPSR